MAHYPLMGKISNSIFTGLEVSDHGTRMWFLNGWLHRDDGPAMIYVDGRIEWAIHGTFIHSYNEFQRLTGCDDSVIMLLRLKYGEIKNNHRDKIKWIDRNEKF